MRVLFATNQLDVGGIETNLVRLTRALRSRGHEVAVAARPGSLSGEIADAGGHLVPLRCELRRPMDIRHDARTMRATITTWKPDVVHAFSAKSVVLLNLARVGPGRKRDGSRPPLVSTIMGLQTRPDEARWRVMLRAYLTALGADKLIVTAPAIGEVVRRLPLGRGTVIDGNVVGVEVLPHVDDDGARAVLGLPAHARIVTTIGRLDPSKSHDLFVRAAAVLLRARPEAHFLLVGSGPEKAMLESLIEELGIADRVHLLGERRDIPRLLSITDVYIRPGIVEGFIGITALEAQAMGTPVVAFETEDVRLAVRDGITGLLVERGSAAALAAGVGRLLDDRDLAMSIGEEGRRLVSDRYEIGRVTGRLECLYLAVTSAAGPDR